MAIVKKDYYFYQGRNGKVRGYQGPGILVENGQYKFRLNKTSKDKTQFKMYCVQQGNPQFSCKVEAKVAKKEEKENEIVRLNPNQPKNTRN